MATSNLGYQSFYQAQLTSNIDDTELIIPLDTAPIPDEGFLVIESTVASKREIIYYTSKTSNSVTCPAGAGLGRGYDGTTAVSHLSGSAVIMAPVAAMFESLTDLFTTTPQGWTNQTPAISAVTANGNRSYTLTHASSIASVVSPGMRRRFTRTVAANTYMGGAFNGSSHYFTKTSPTGTLGTVTNNFTIEVTYQPTSYPAARRYLCGRADATPNNGLGIFIEPSGQIGVTIFSGGAANYRTVSTYQSLPLNKKTTIAATWASGTVTISFDGVSVPVAAATTGGSAPTTAGTGGDWSIGRFGAYTPSEVAGYISNVAVFDAVLSAATIRQHATYKLTGSETNCIGAWSLDNTANDQSAAGNNLTAMNSVGFSNKSPFGNDGISSTLEYALSMSVSSDGLTEVVQVPEGCALPTTGGITASAYSSMANPYGWVGNKGRWAISSYYFNTISATGVSSYSQFGSVQFSVPIGTFDIGYQCSMILTSTNTTGGDLSYGLSTSTGSITDTRLRASIAISVANIGIYTPTYRRVGVTLAAATTYYMAKLAGANVSSQTMDYGGELFAIPNGL